MKKLINKKNVVIAVIVAILIGVSAYMLANKKSDVKTNTEKTSEVTTKEDKKNTVKSDTKKEDKKDDKKEVKEDKKSDTKVEETKTTEVTDTNTSTNVSNNTSSTTVENKNTVSNNGCKTVYHEAVTHNVYHEAVTQQVWVVDTPAHDETTYTVVYYIQLSNGEKWYSDGSADFASRVADYAVVNGLSYSTGVENQPNTVHYDEVGHYETQVVSQAWTETVVDTPAYTTCE